MSRRDASHTQTQVHPVPFANKYLGSKNLRCFAGSFIMKGKEMSSRFGLIACGVFAIAGMVFSTVSCARTTPIGDPLSIVEMRAVRAMGCGQFPSTQGNGNCGIVLPPCVTAPAPPPYNGGVVCVPTGAACDGCQGGTHITCFGVLDPASTTDCATFGIACCVPKGCFQGVGVGAIGLCSCKDGALAPPAFPFGPRWMSSLTYSSPACPGIQE